MFNQPQNFTSILIPVPLTSFDNDPPAGLCLDDIGHLISSYHTYHTYQSSLVSRWVKT